MGRLVGQAVTFEDLKWYVDNGIFTVKNPFNEATRLLAKKSEIESRLNVTQMYGSPNRAVRSEELINGSLPTYPYKYIPYSGDSYCESVIYLSIEKSGSATKVCGTGYTGTIETYVVSAGTYTSSISQIDADNQAQADVDTNKQNYANTVGTCNLNIFWNIYTKGDYIKDCPSGETGSTVTYEVFANTYSGTTQDQADSLALSDVIANGQNYANSTGTCTPLITPDFSNVNPAVFDFSLYVLQYKNYTVETKLIDTDGVGYGDHTINATGGPVSNTDVLSRYPIPSLPGNYAYTIARVQGIMNPTPEDIPDNGSFLIRSIIDVGKLFVDYPSATNVYFSVQMIRNDNNSYTRNMPMQAWSYARVPDYGGTISLNVGGTSSSQFNPNITWNNSVLINVRVQKIGTNNFNVYYSYTGT